MMEMEKPKIFVEENETNDYAKITVEPLEKGFGLTSMEDNVVASKGKIDFVHQEGQGFKIIVKWSK